MKVIKSLENREILLKGITRKITTSQKRGFLNFLRSMKSVLTPLAISVLLPCALTAATDAVIQRKFLDNSWTIL